MKPLRITIFVFENFPVLDSIGPYEVHSKIPGTEIYITSIEGSKVI